VNQCVSTEIHTVPFLTLAIGIYMTKTLDRVNKLFSRNFEVKFEIWQNIRLVFYTSISVNFIVQNKIITEL
jgi:hypothetical protein